MTVHAETTVLGAASSNPRLRVSMLLLTLAAAGILSLAALGCEESRAPAKVQTAANATTPETPSKPESADNKSTAGAPEVAAQGPDVVSMPEVKTEPPAAAPAAEDTSTRNISFDRIKFDLKANADYKPEMLTPEIKALDGKNVRIRGFMFPSFKPTGLTEWVLVRDNLQCCFGGNAILYDCIIVDMKPGKATDYTTRPVAVEGTFTIKDWFDIDGVRRAIYHLDGESVRF